MSEYVQGLSNNEETLLQKCANIANIRQSNTTQSSTPLGLQQQQPAASITNSLSNLGLGAGPAPLSQVIPKVYTPDEKYARSVLIFKIRRYKTSSFGPILGQALDQFESAPDPGALETELLEQILADCKLFVANRQDLKTYINMYKVALRMVEMIAVGRGIKCAGLTDTLGDSKEAHDNIEEYYLSTDMSANMGPISKLAMVTAGTILTLHKANTMSEKLAAQKKSEAEAAADAKTLNSTLDAAILKSWDEI